MVLKKKHEKLRSKKTKNKQIMIKKMFLLSRFKIECDCRYMSVFPVDLPACFTSLVIPKWRTGPPASKVDIRIHNKSTMFCDAIADPPPTYSWYRDGKQIITSR